MPKSVPRTREIANAAAVDEANRSMRKAGRKAWNRTDYNTAVREFNRLWMLEDEYPWASAEQIAEMKRQLGYA